MTFPAQWVSGVGLPLPSGVRSLRFYAEDTATANFADRAYAFGSGSTIPVQPRVQPGQEVASGNAATPVISSPMGGASPQTALPAAYSIRIYNDGTDPLEFSFDGTHVHGVVMGGKEALYRRRFEPGICVRGRSASTPAFRIEAW